MYNDTIASIATGMTDAGIGIIRVSGDDAISAVDNIFKKLNNEKLSDVKSHTMHYGFIYDGEERLDQVLVSVMRNPRSYTGEDTVEINCHGGIYIVNKVLELVLSKGVRLAEPGEFTKRAFLNGKLDLSEAEAVMDLIGSKNDFALKNSLRQLSGSIFDEIKNVREDILYEIAYIESALDDPEHFDLTDYPGDLHAKIESILERLNILIDNSRDGKIRKDGILSVIVGKPNAGKSSFLNMVTNEDRAIVTSIAGTTRDVLEESVKLDDMVLNIVDTAGIRDTDDEVEKIGVNRARKYVADADLILYMVDSSVDLDDNDDEIIEMLKDKKIMVLMNKSDLSIKVSKQDIADILGEETVIISISAKENQGLDEFKNALRKMFYEKKLSINDEVIITNTRQINEIKESMNSLLLVNKSIEDGMPEDFYSIDLQNAYSHLGFIIGEEIDDDVVDEIFSKFCMGK